MILARSLGIDCCAGLIVPYNFCALGSVSFVSRKCKDVLSCSCWEGFTGVVSAWVCSGFAGSVRVLHSASIECLRVRFPLPPPFLKSATLCYLGGVFFRVLRLCLLVIPGLDHAEKYATWKACRSGSSTDRRYPIQPGRARGGRMAM